MCETMQSSHLLSDVLGVEVFFLAPTASGDLLCASRVGTETWTGGNFKDYIRFVSCHLFGPVNHGQNWKGRE
jgi:hypothetical protein